MDTCLFCFFSDDGGDDVDDDDKDDNDSLMYASTLFICPGVIHSVDYFHK